MMKALKIGLVLLLVLIVAIVVVLVFWGGQVVKQGVERVAPRVLGVPVTLEQARFRPWQGQIRLRGMFVGNPEGFHTDSLFESHNLEVDLNVRSLFSDPIVIDRILIDAPMITYEVGLGRTNLGTLLDNLESDAEPVPEDPDDESARGMVIREFILADAEARVSATAMRGESATIRLSTIRLTDLGGEDQSLVQITSEVLGAVLIAVTGAIKDSGDLLSGGLQSAISEAGAISGEAVERARSITDSVDESVRGLLRGDDGPRDQDEPKE